MPRAPRITFPGLICHITQRGNRRRPVFFSSDDRDSYMRRLAWAAARFGLEIWAYCLMTNHVHLLVRSLFSNSMANTMREVQGRYSMRLNERHGWTGHLWANRFRSHPVEPDRACVVARYIERNPVRAGMTRRPEEYPWSSARAHCELEGPGILSPNRPFPGVLGDWGAWLDGADGTGEGDLRESIRSGLPFGSAAFLRELEQSVGRSLERRPVGRPRNPMRCLPARPGEV